MNQILRNHEVRLTNAGTAAISHHNEIERLYEALSKGRLPQRTAKLMSAPSEKKARKLVEEATEVAIDAVRGNRQGVVAESADVIYHLVVLWAELGIDPDEIWAEMAQRSRSYGLAEKRAKKPASIAGFRAPSSARSREIGPVYLRPSRGSVR
ncbi:MAG: phosphoribosyl-ATP diphosphatase [Rhizobiaceae bacterium]